MKSPIVRTIELWRDAGRYAAAAHLAAVSFPGDKHAAARFDLIDAICLAALESGDLAAAEEIRDKSPEDVSIETNWAIDDFLDCIEIVEQGDPAIIAAARKAG